MSKILDFVEKSLNDTENIADEFSLGIVPNAQGQKIAAATELKSISGAEKILTAHAVRHAFVRHSSKKLELERGQIAIEKSDFDFLPDILSNPTTIERGDTQNRKRNEVIKLSKTIKGKLYTVLVSVVYSKKEGTRLFFNTMFIKK